MLLFFATTQAKATFTIWADTVSGANGSQVDISVKVREFTDIISFQGTLQWNVSVATYNSTLSYNLPFLTGSNFGTTQTGTGKLTFSWNDNNLTGVTVPAGTTIFKIRFNLVGSGGSSTPVTFVNSPTPMEIVDLSFLPIAFVTNPGKIDVTGGGSCAITNLAAGTQTACNPGNNTYTQQVTVTYNNAPGTGTLNVNGQSFAITSSPQTVTLTGLSANGAAVNVTANFSASPGCALTANNLFTAPASCASGVFKIFADSVSGNTGSQVDVPVRANEWTNLIAAQGTVSWNTSIATYNSMTFFGLPNMTLSNFGTTQVGTGKLTFSWNDPTLVGVTVPDSAIIFTIRFNIVGTPGSQTPVSFVNSPTPLEFTDNSFTVIPHTTRNGNIRVNGSLPQFKIFADSVQGPTLTTVDCPVRANDFNNLIAMQGTVDWGGTSVATYNSIPFFGLPNMSISNFGTTQVGSGKLTFSWNDPTLVGVTVPDSAILFTVRYNLVGPPGAVTPVTFTNSPTPLEFTDNTFTVITHSTRNGQLKIISAGNTITTGTVTGLPFCAGATFNLPFTITGTYTPGNVFTAQLSDASGSFGSPVTIGTLTSTTAGTISCTIPGGTVTGTGYRVRVISSTPAVTGSDNGVNFTINAIPATPTVTASGPTTFCAPGSVNLTSSSATGNVWSPGGATTQTITVTTSGTYTVSVTTAGCTSAASAPVVVTVNAAPSTPTITPSGPTTFCSGGSVTLTSSAASGYLWTPGGATTQSINVTASGSYTVQVTGGNGCTATSAPTVVTVNALPSTPTITPSGPTTFCAGGSVTLTAPAATSYLWSPGGATTQSINVTSGGSYTVQVTNGSGCSATSAPTVVTVNALPATPTITPSGPTTFCAGGSVNLTSTAATSYLWSPGGATTQTITATASGSYTVQVTNGSGCTATSAPTVVTVNALPSTPTITPSGPTTFCTGGSVTLTAPAATSYLWSPGGATTQSIVATTSGSYTVQVTNGNGCSATSAPTVVTVNPLPATPTITPSGPTTFCAGGSVTLTSNSATNNVWTPGGATTQSINVTTSGTYSVVVNNGGCTSLPSNTITVTVNALPATPTITPSGPTSFCSGGSVNLTSSSATGNVWTPGGATTQTITATTSGSYTVQVTDGNGCTATSAPTVVTVNPLPATPTITPSGPTTFCAGGSVTLTSSSAVNNVWTPGGATTQSINVTTSGTYSVVVNNGGCTSLPSNTITVTVNALPATPTITPSGPTSFCSGGSVNLTSSSATGNVWTPGGATTQTITATTSGSYTVQVTDGNGCTATSAPTVVTVNPLPATPTITPSGPTTFCAGGSVTLTSSSAVNNVWTPGGATTQSINVTTSGTYSVVVNNGGCTSLPSNTITVTVNALPATPTITPSGPTSFCSGGSVNLTSSSATGNVWTPGGATTQTITATTSGSYTVQVTDGNGCTATSAPTVVTVNPLPATPTITPSGPTTFCAGGSVTLTSSSAVNNVWTPGGATTQSINVTISGTYSVVVNNGGCTSLPSNTITVTVNALPATPTITPSGPTSFCSGGSVNLTSSSATGNVWTPGGATTQTITATTSGSYTVQVTDGNGCTATSAPTVVTVNPLPATPTITPSGPTTFCAGGSVTLTSSSAVNNVWTPGGATTQSINVTTSGTYSVVVNNGGCTSLPSNTITVTVNALPATPTITPSGPTTFCTGGSVNLTSSAASGNLWTPGGATTQTITATTSGSYTVQVTDGNGCTATSAPTVVTVNTSAVTPTITPSGPTTFCTGGSVNLTSSAASTYLWSPGGATTQTINVTTSGSYTVQITDVNGCSATSAPTVVTVNPVPSTPVISAGGPTTFCAGGNVVLTSNSATNNVWTPGGATTQSITVTASGSYSVVVNNGGCASAPSNSITVTVNPLPATPTITPSGPTTFCTGGSVTLTASSASGYLWSPGGATTQSIVATTSGSYTVQVTDGNGCSATSAPTVVTVNPVPSTPTITPGGPTTFCAGGSVTLTSSSATNNVWTPGGATTQSISATTSGTYSVVVNNGGCTSAPSNAITVTVNALPPTPNITASGPTTFCTGGSVTLTAPLASSYLWSPGGATTQSITVSTSGSYTVQVTNAAGCSATSAPTVVTVNTSAVTPVVTPSGPTTFCSGGSVTLTSSSASGYVWSPGGATTQSINVTTSGSYTVQITDVNGCTATSAPTVVTVNPIPAAPTVTASGPTTFCAGGNVTLTSSVATGNTWSPGGATTQSITVSASGSYTVTQTVAGCTSPASTPTVVTVNPIPATPTITPSGPTTFCAGGSVVLTSSSATGNVWSPGGATTQSITVTTSGSYTVQVTNAGCTSGVSAPTVVTVNPIPAAPTVTASGPTTFCSGGNVVLTSSVSTGNTWSPGGATTQSITVTASGSYTVTQTVAGCTSPASTPTVVTVTPAPPGPTITPSGPTTFCAGGSVTLNSSASTGNTWSPGGATTQAITVTASGTYTVTQTISGCTSAPSTPVTVTVNPLPSTPTVTPSGATTFCAGGSVTLTSSNASGNVWSPGGQTTQSIVVTASGTYTVMATALGCSSATSTPVTVTVNPAPAVPTITASGPTSFCIGGSVTLTSSSATNNTWTPGGATTQSITATASGSYTVQVSNGFGCTATSAPTVVTASTQPATPTITASGPTTFCPGGSVTLTSSSSSNNTWSPGGQTSPSIVANASGSYTVVVTNQGCASNPSSPIVVTVSPLPVAQFTSNTAGLTATFTDNSLNSPTAWSWTFGDGGTSTLQNPTHTYATAGSYSVCLTTTNTCGINVSCQTVTVCQPPAAAFTQSANLLQLTFSDASTGGPTTWSWDFGDGGTSTSQNPTHTYATAGSYNVCLTATNACSTSTTCHNVTVTCPPPVAGFTAIVLGFTGNFTIQSSSAGTPTYAWDFGDGATSTLFNPSHTYSVGGLYTVCLTITTECGVDTQCDTISVACPTPATDFSFSGNTAAMAFVDLSTNTPNSWAWDFGDGGTSTLQNPTHSYAVPGIFHVCLTATNDCGANTTCKDVDVISGVSDGLEWSDVSLFPNPARDLITVAGFTAVPGALEIEVTDLFGRRLIVHTSRAGAQFSEDVSIERLASAVYFVKVTRGDKSRTFRLVKE